jgi:hypothetical protein
MKGLCAASIMALLATASAASAQTQYPAPGSGDPDVLRRCQGTLTLTQRTICDNGDLRGLARDIRRYVGLMRDRDPSQAGALASAQDAYRQQLERDCGNLTTSDGYDGPAYRCIRLHQRLRLVSLASAAMGNAITGLYRANRPDLSGELTIVEWPDGTAEVMIDTLTPPDARTCNIQFTSATGPALSGTPVGAPACHVGVDALGGTATVRSSGDCRAVCVLRGRPDGLYRR